jgi:hypothetical protein
MRDVLYRLDEPRIPHPSGPCREGEDRLGDHGGIRHRDIPRGSILQSVQPHRMRDLSGIRPTGKVEVDLAGAGDRAGWVRDLYRGRREVENRRAGRRAWRDRVARHFGGAIRLTPEQEGHQRSDDGPRVALH